MRKVVYLLLLVLLVTLAKVSSYGQDPQFSQFYASSMYINPAFAGSGHYTRAHIHERVQWPGLGAKYTTHLIAMDKYFDEYQSGFGAYVFHDRQGGNTYSSSEIAFQYAYEVQLNDELALSMGIQAAGVHRYIDYSRLQFSYQYTDNDGFDGSSNGLDQPSKIYADFGSGFLLYSDDFWFGTSWHHMNMPNLAVLGDRAPLPMKLSFMTGYKIRLNKNTMLTFEDHEKDVSITPTAHFKMQGASSQLDLGVYGIYDHLLFGGWYRGIPIKKYNNQFQNHESIVLMAGWKIFLRMEIRYSYDFTISTLNKLGTGGAHEISASVLLRKSFRRKPQKRLPCPSHHIIKSYDFY